MTILEQGIVDSVSALSEESIDGSKEMGAKKDGLHGERLRLQRYDEMVRTSQVEKLLSNDKGERHYSCVQRLVSRMRIWSQGRDMDHAREKGNHLQMTWVSTALCLWGKRQDCIAGWRK